MKLKRKENMSLFPALTIMVNKYCKTAESSDNILLFETPMRETSAEKSKSVSSSFNMLLLIRVLLSCCKHPVKTFIKAVYNYTGFLLIGIFRILTE